MSKLQRRALFVYILSTTINSFFQTGFIVCFLYLTLAEQFVGAFLFISGGFLIIEVVSSVVFGYRNPLFVEEGKTFRITNPRKAIMSLGFNLPSFINLIVLMSLVSFVLPVESYAVMSPQVLMTYWAIELVWRSATMGVAIGSIVWLVRFYRSTQDEILTFDSNRASNNF